MCNSAIRVLFAIAAVVPALADTVTFDFNSLASGASTTQIRTYMNGVLGSGKSVTVTGATSDKSYTGDGHVVGPCLKDGSEVDCTAPDASKPRSVTLGTSDGTTQHLSYTDTFLKNNSSSTFIAMTFSGLQIFSVSFDYEIFPDGTCPSGTCSSSNWPDFTFKADGTLVFRTLAVVPGNTGALYTHSPNSGRYSTEAAPQFLGQSGVIALDGVTELEFIDWPRTIGIDNLVLGTTPPNPPQSTVPEPDSIVLFGTLLLVTAGAFRRQRRRLPQ